MFRSLPLLLAVLVAIQGAAANAESRLAATDGNGRLAPASARLAFTIEIPSVLTLQLAETDIRAAGLMDGATDITPAALRLSTNRGKAVLSCAVGAIDIATSALVRIDRTLATPPAAGQAQPDSPIGCGSVSYSAGTIGLSDVSMATPVASRWLPTSQTAPIRLYTASQP